MIVISERSAEISNPSTHLEETDNPTTSDGHRSDEYNKLKERIKNLTKQNNRLRSHNVRLIEKQKKFKVNEGHVTRFLEGTLPTNLFEIVKANLVKKEDRGQRYTSNLKRFAVTLYSLSPKSYRLLRSQMKMPSESTVKQEISKWNCSSGINNMFFEGLKQKLEQESQTKPLYKYILICIDEMKIRCHLKYNLKDDSIVGLSDFKKHDEPQSATHATVFLARGLFENFKQTLAYYLVHGSMNASDLKNSIRAILEKLRKCGFKVIGIVTDMGSNFVKFASDMGVTQENPYFVENGEKVFYFFDSPHLLKATRNCLMNNHIEFTSANLNAPVEASWQPIVDLFEADKTKSIRLLPKLKQEHISPNNNQKMRVKYAAQILSASVAAALSNQYNTQHASQTYLATAEIAMTFNKLFDFLNSSNAAEAYRGEETKVAYLQEATEFVSNMSIRHQGKNVTRRFTFKKKWPITISAIILLWDEVKDIPGVNHILTRRINQDPIENFFGLLRNSCGNNRNPTAEQFIGGFKRQLYNPIQDERQIISAEGNCQPDLDHDVFSPNELLTMNLTANEDEGTTHEDEAEDIAGH